MRGWLASLSVTARTGIETVLALCVLALVAAASGVFSRLDNVIYDLAITLRARPAPPDIVIVAIDERSLAELGRWPWSRALHARIVDRLTEAGTAVVAFDVLFEEPQTDDPDADPALARAIAAHGRVVLPVYPQFDAQARRTREVQPLPSLAQAAAALGHVDVELDADAVVRRSFLFGGQGSPRWPGLALAVHELAVYGRPRRIAPATDDGAWWVRSAEFLVPFAGGAGHFRRVSAVDVLREQRSGDHLRGAIALIGATAVGLQRDFATPVSGLGQPLSGVEVHANVLDTLRQGLGIRRLPWPWALLLAVVPLVLAVAAYARASIRTALVAALLLLASVVAVALLLPHAVQTWVSPTPALLAVLLSYPLYAWRRLERTSRSLATEQQRGLATLRAIGDAVITTDREGRVTFVNPQAERISGVPAERLHGRPVADALDFADPAERERFVSALAQCASATVPTATVAQATVRNTLGRDYDVRICASPVRQPGQQVEGIVVALTDLTENVAMTRRIAHQATHDSLTGLPNRTLLVDRLEHAIAAARRDHTALAVLFLDLDDFKRVNDGFGHAVGDDVLREVAQRLTAASRASDTVARWGGDEFLIVAEEVPDAESAALVARKLIDRLAPSIAAHGHELLVSASIGISLYPRDGIEPQALVQNADRAMYRAKHLGHSRIQFFAESINQQASDRREIEAGLRSAIARNELELQFQPQVDLGWRTICGAEVLLRWRHPQAGLLPPERFIAVAEECGLIHEIGAWVLNTACQRSASWRAAGQAPVPLSVNVSPRQLHGEELTSMLAAVLADTGLDPATLVLEITENAVMHDIERVASILREIRRLGVKISIDDFGIGYSSLSLLRRLPVDQIKIDRSFVRGVADHPGDAAITRGVIAMAKGMGMSVVAEGVETPAQIAFLREHGCDAAQGFVLSPPLSEAQFVEAMRQLAALAPEHRARFFGGLSAQDESRPPTRH